MNAVPRVKLLIRADAGGKLGSGHIMRMIALGQAVPCHEKRVTLATCQCPENISRLVRDAGLNHRDLGCGDYGTVQDAEKTILAAQHAKADWIILDGYHFDEAFQVRIHQSGFRTAVLDDYGHSPGWYADLIINPNIGAENIVYTSEVHNATAVTGIKYTLFRKEFQDRDWNNEAGQGIPLSKLLITMGGVDPDNCTCKILKALELLPDRNLSVRVIAGGGNRHYPTIRDVAAVSRHCVQVIRQTNDMVSQYAWADGVISASGSTCYEWLLMGLPAAVMMLAGNQRNIYQEVTQRGLAIGLGSTDSLTETDLAQQIRELIANRESTRHSMDCHGSRRIVSILDNSGIWFRPAMNGDARKVFNLTNDPFVRQYSINPESVAWDDHVRWFERQLCNRYRVMLLAFNGADEFIGQVRFRKDPELENAWDISYSICQEFRGKGLGQKVLGLAADNLYSITRSPLNLRGWIKEDNIASRKIFEGLGFVRESDASVGHLNLYTKQMV